MANVHGSSCDPGRREDDAIGRVSADSLRLSIVLATDTVMLGHFSKEALEISKRLGRQPDLMLAFEHLARIPLSFPAKAQVGACLNGTSLADRASSTKPIL